MRLIICYCLVLFVCLCCAQQQLVEQHDVAEVRLQVSTTFGEPLGKVVVILKAIGPTAQFRQVGNTIHFEHIPFGLYDLEIQASGFSTRRERVGIYRPQVRLWFGLFPSLLHSDELGEVLGSIPALASRENLWVRLVPRYASDFIEDQVISGEFHLSGISPGQYFLLLFDKEKLLLTKPIDYFGRKLTLNLDVKD